MLDSEINALLNEVCFMDAPFSVRLEMAAAVVRAATAGGDTYDEW
jgi:hypothetical protein